MERLRPISLAAFFDEDSFREWIGIKENKVPFTLGLKLEEPAGPDDFWELELFFVIKKNLILSWIMGIRAIIPLNGYRYERRWNKNNSAGSEFFLGWRGDKGLTDKLTEDEAWLFLTEASETLLALGVDILLPSWWQAMKSASLKVKAKVKGNSMKSPPVLCWFAGDA